MPTSNKLSRLKLVIASLMNQEFPVDKFELIIINDASDDGTSQYLNSLELPFQLRVINNRFKSGRSFSRNCGASLASYDLLLFIDDDVILSPNFLLEHSRQQKILPRVLHGQILNLPYLRYFQDPSEGVFYPHINQQKLKKSQLKKYCISRQDLTENFQSKIAEQSKQSAIEKIIFRFMCFDQKFAWFGFTGGNVSLLKRWFDGVNGFDEGFGLHWGCEDLELGYRLHQKRFKFDYLENAKNYHLAHDRSSFDIEHVVNVDYFYKKHKEELILLFQSFVKRELNSDEFIACATAPTRNT